MDITVERSVMNGATIVLRKVSVVSYFLRKEKMHTQILLCLIFSALSLKMRWGESSLGEGLV